MYLLGSRYLKKIKTHIEYNFVHESRLMCNDQISNKFELPIILEGEIRVQRRRCRQS